MTHIVYGKPYTLPPNMRRVVEAMRNGAELHDVLFDPMRHWELRTDATTVISVATKTGNTLKKHGIIEFDRPVHNMGLRHVYKLAEGYRD